MLHTDSQITQSEYQRSLDEGIPDPQKLNTQTVRYWSDFNRVFYHPRSIVQINDYELNSSLMPFEKWGNGEELFVSMDTDNDLLDRDVRVWAEECDQMQGMQIFTGGDDAWGGFASRYVEKLRDEYGKMPIWTWGIEEEQGRGQMAKQLLRTINTATTINEMARSASLYVPLSIPAIQLPHYVHLNRDSQWHISALLSTALESMTLPSRLRPDQQRRGLLGDIEAGLNVNGNQSIAQLQCTILAPATEAAGPVNGYGRHDDRAPSNIVHAINGEGDGDMITSQLDMNLSTGDRGSSSYASQHDTSEHVFGAVENMRGKRQEADDQKLDEDEITYARKRRRLAGSSVVERFVARQSLLFRRLLVILHGKMLIAAGTNRLLHFPSSIASPGSSRCNQIQQRLTYTPHYPPQPTSRRVLRLYRSSSTGWSASMSAKHSQMDLARSAKPMKRGGTEDRMRTAMTDGVLDSSLH